MIRTGRNRLKKTVFPLFFISSVLLFSKTFLQKKSSASDKKSPPTTTALYLKPISPPTYSHLSARPCTHLQPTILAIVHSSPTHVLHRKAIRQTWGSAAYTNTTIRTVFIVGRSTLPKVQSRVEVEAAEHGDIVLIDILDSYRNLTHKHLAGLNWAFKNCPTVVFVLKVDDDAFVNIKRSLKFLKSADLSNDIIACRVVPQGTSPRRSGKWMVTQLDFPQQEYPEYCSGLAYFARPDTLKKVYEAAMSGRVPYLWIDDVYITGLAAQLATVGRLDIGVWFAWTDQDVIKWLKNGASKHVLPWFVAEMTPRHWPKDAIALWEKLNKANA